MQVEKFHFWRKQLRFINKGILISCLINAIITFIILSISPLDPQGIVNALMTLGGFYFFYFTSINVLMLVLELIDRKFNTKSKISNRKFFRVVCYLLFVFPFIFPVYYMLSMLTYD